MSAFPRNLLCFPFAWLFLSSCETTSPELSDRAAAPGATAPGVEASGVEASGVEASGVAAPEDVMAEPAEVIAAYPLDLCLVSDEPLGSRNDDRVLFHEGREVKVCCKDCLMSFKLSPDKYLAKLP